MASEVAIEQNLASMCIWLNTQSTHKLVFSFLSAKFPLKGYPIED